VEPVQRLERSLCSESELGVRLGEVDRGLTPNSAELSSGNLTGETSMKLNAFHCDC
jgi:hypothetical protein